MIDNSFFINLNKLLSFNSERGESEPNAPFGKEVKDCLNFFLDLAKSFGFDVINYDNYVGEVSFGNGEEIGIIGHLDVVPKGNGWEAPPYALTEKDGYLIGRGIADDKGPTLATLYALKFIKDNNLPCYKKFRLFVGTNEETGWEDLAYLKSKTTLPEYGFSPDGNFPVSYAEKGVYRLAVKLPNLINYRFTNSGIALNAVCDKAEIIADKPCNESLMQKYGLKEEKGKILSVGKSAHGAYPHLGINALKNIFAYLAEEGEDVKNIYEILFLDKLRLFSLADKQGNLTFSPNVIKEEKDGFTLFIDMRVPYPVNFNLDVKPLLDKSGLTYTAEEKHPPFFIDENCNFIQTLLSSYNETTGENLKPEFLCGSTFARAFNKGCAFGFEFPNENYHIHEANERIKKESFIKGYNILKTAIIKLAGTKEKL